ncbi:Isochorismatase-like protein [Aspergillus crustosus]
MSPVYSLNIDDAVVLFVDHQSGLIQLVRDFEPNEFHTNVLGLVRLTKYFNLPAVLTTSFDTGPNGPIVKEIVDELPNAPLIRRPGQINAMDNEDFVNAIKAAGRKQIIISGVLTELCVAFPALTLIEQGYDVFVVTDASGTFKKHTREAAHKRMAARDVEGFGKIWTDYLPRYWALMQSYQNTIEQRE